MRRAKSMFPEVKEFFFDDDTLTDNGPRVEEIARRLGKLGITWSCNAKPNVPRSTLEIMKANGLRLLLVGYESGNQKVLNNMKKGTRLDIIRRFSKDCRELGIKVHGTFILGMPGETPETIARRSTSRARWIPRRSRSRSPRPIRERTSTNRRPRTAGSRRRATSLVDTHGVQHAALNYPGLTSTMMFEVGRRVLPALLLPSAQDVLAARRDDRRSSGDETPPARGRRSSSTSCASANAKRKRHPGGAFRRQSRLCAERKTEML